MNTSSDNQFTALGPADIGFQTNGAHITVGADITGNKIGVQGSGPIGVSGIGSRSTTTNPNMGVSGSCDTGSGVDGRSKSGAGVSGLSTTGIGVFGESTVSRGGVFASGTGRGAQLQLRPQIVPFLPRDGQEGDLFAARVNNPLEPCQLWFCVISASTDGHQPAQWSQVLLGSPFSGRI
jgi:hypothetical protein